MNHNLEADYDEFIRLLKEVQRARSKVLMRWSTRSILHVHRLPELWKQQEFLSGRIQPLAHQLLSAMAPQEREDQR